MILGDVLEERSDGLCRLAAEVRWEDAPRDPQQLRANLARATKLHARIYREWASLRQQYRDAAARVASYEAWQETFNQHTESELRR